MEIKEAIIVLASIVPRLDELKSAQATAKDNCDESAEEAVKDEREALLTAHTEAFCAVWGQVAVNDNRRAMVCRVAETAPKPAELRKLATAVRIGTNEGITLPAGRFAGLSRGKGWCRQGSGSSAEWISAENGWYPITERGKYIVGSSDGYSRKEQTPWTVYICCGYFCAD